MLGLCMGLKFKVGDEVAPKFNFDEYELGKKYTITSIAPHEVYLTVYNFLSEDKDISDYPCMFADVRFDKYGI